MKPAPDEDKAIFDNLKYYNISDDPLFVAKKNLNYLNKNYPDKVLSVHNDYIAKVFQSRAMGFNGIEFNVETSNLNIGHPPEYILDISAESYLEKISELNFSKLWFDLKSHENEDLSELLNHLNNLDTIYSLKEKSLIESWENGLKELVDNGWKTSFYINFENDKDLQNCIPKEKCINKIFNRIIDSKTQSISFFAKDYNFVKTYLEPILPAKISYHVFGFGYEHQVFNPKMIENVKVNDIFNDPRVDLILLDGDQTYKYSKF